MTFNNAEDYDNISLFTFIHVLHLFTVGKWVNVHTYSLVVTFPQ